MSMIRQPNTTKYIPVKTVIKLSYMPAKSLFTCGLLTQNQHGSLSFQFTNIDLVIALRDTLADRDTWCDLSRPLDRVGL